MFTISSVGILAPKYVCLDTYITVISETEADILESLCFQSAILENGCHLAQGANLRWPYS